MHLSYQNHSKSKEHFIITSTQFKICHLLLESIHFFQCMEILNSAENTLHTRWDRTTNNYALKLLK